MKKQGVTKSWDNRVWQRRNESTQEGMEGGYEGVGGGDVLAKPMSLACIETMTLSGVEDLH